jgi:hypothetical protein
VACKDVFLAVAPTHDPRDIEELVHLRHGGALDNLTRAELKEAAEIAAEALTEAPDLARF